MIRSVNTTATYFEVGDIIVWANVNKTGKVSDTSVLVVDKQGLVTAVGIGEATVTVTTYSGVSAVCKFIVGIADSNIPEIPAEEDSITAATGSALTPQ